MSNFPYEPDQLDYWQRYHRDSQAIDDEDGYTTMPRSFTPRGIGNPDPKQECPECNQPLPACECR